MQAFVSFEKAQTENAKWIDARFSLQNKDLGKEKYNEEHIQNAVHWDLADDLSAESEGGGRHPLPSKECLTKLFRTSGLQLEDTILIYDEGGSPFAARAWWILQYGGFTNARILIEGYEELKQKGVPVDHETFVSPAQSSVEPDWQDQLYASRREVEEIAAGNGQAMLIDARAQERYSGENEPIDKKAGHIPTARNFDWEQLKCNGRYDVQNAAGSLEKIAKTEEPVVVYCGSGVTASPLFAALTDLGYSNVKLYVGSFSDWISQEDAPVETSN
ncbi:MULTISPECIES: sulfurtransferase [Sporosarcina]|uniref:sulfurtransferase n=1 Tax=Sporosarcina TaxID=1569 RepID=UPI001E5CBACD|nr:MULTISPECIES: sulfurtransferase [Sporosarcina]GKV67249.1 thiosulfate sulfurtransferase [Sporosarcina sp. NCCP-2331]GLB57605.1 thiosulfate sulfurtransferase [Sporosarcina sp. NCCP-2378]